MQATLEVTHRIHSTDRDHDGVFSRLAIDFLLGKYPTSVHTECALVDGIADCYRFSGIDGSLPIAARVGESDPSFISRIRNRLVKVRSKH